MPSHDPTDVEIVLNGKTHYLRSTPLAMRGISQLLGGYQGALSSLINMQVECAITLISFGLNRTKPKDTELINDLIYQSGGMSELYKPLEEYLIRVFHGGRIPENLQKPADGEDLGGEAEANAANPTSA